MSNVRNASEARQTLSARVGARQSHGDSRDSSACRHYGIEAARGPVSRYRDPLAKRAIVGKPRGEIDQTGPSLCNKRPAMSFKLQVPRKVNRYSPLM